MFNRKTLTAIALLAAGTAGPALADDAGHGNGYDKIWAPVHGDVRGGAAGSEDARKDVRRNTANSSDARVREILRMYERQSMN